VNTAGPSTPVEVLGLSGVPNAGDRVDVVADLRKAQAIADSRAKRVAKATGTSDSGVSLEKLHEMMAAGELPELRLESVPLRALEQREDVASVAVDVHQVGVEPADGEPLVRGAHVSQYGCAHPRLTSSAPRGQNCAVGSISISRRKAT